MSKLISIILSVVVAVIGIWFIIYIIGLIKDDEDVALSPTPTLSAGPRTPSYTLNPFPPANPTPIYTPPPTPNVTKGGLDAYLSSGIYGKVTLKKCPTCVESGLADISIAVRQLDGAIAANIKTGTDGRFSTRLAPGQYVIGPVQEPSSGAFVQATRIAVNPNYYSEALITFSSSY